MTQTCHKHPKVLTTLQLFLLLLFLQLLFLLHSCVGHEGVAAGKRLVPMKTEREFRAGVDLMTGGGGGRRRLDPFQLCSECKCCEAPEDTGNCTTTSCCFGIDCQLPNKPFGVCAFVPQSCNCTSCNVI
ncbi:hypothetical protein DM860_002738 [Cuscuta australis]|uniref:DUF7866 domain-containing protein n=1 Tax=Cuscuta australis TaxID=267555 RepID=A0A328D0C4_9ASTE|nr:hypothetical protein DM860_002738 [Cuscuta australis]